MAAMHLPFISRRRTRDRPAEGSRLADGSRVFYVHAGDDVLLAGRMFGEQHAGERLGVVCLSGLSRNSADFRAIAQHLSTHRKRPRCVVALDYRGRGLSDNADPESYTPLVELRDILAQIDAVGMEHGFVIGTSRGGIIAMLMGAVRPTFPKGVVLNDIGPVLDGRGLARIKTYLRALQPPADWDEAEELVRRIVRNQFPKMTDKDIAEAARVHFREDGGSIVPNFDEKLVEQFGEIDLETVIPDLWPQFESLARIPVMAIRGANSDLLSEETLDAMTKRHPNLEPFTAADEGHAPRLADEASMLRIEAFLTRAEQSLTAS